MIQVAVYYNAKRKKNTKTHEFSTAEIFNCSLSNTVHSCGS
jgi:hypothetical protein